MNNPIVNLWDVDLDYKGENEYSSFFSTEGNFHTYPAKAVPQMVQTLLGLIRETYGIETVLDPFVGSGTVALESKYLGLKFYGSDLNPLSILLSKTKVLTVEETEYTINEINQFLKDNLEINNMVDIVNFKNISYWFLQKHIHELSFLKGKVKKFIKDTPFKYREQFTLILLTALSSTIRQVSLTRNSEFKLFRMSPNKIKEHGKLDSIQLFKENVEVILDLLERIDIEGITDNTPEIYINNAKDLSYLKDKKVDLILTSPPYGDSRSTVAYGQFSRLSIQWLSDLMKEYLNISYIEDNCDEHLLGGKKSKAVINRSEILERSQTLQALYHEMESKVREEESNYRQALEKLGEVEKSLVDIDRERFLEYLNDNELLAGIIVQRIRLSISKKLRHEDEKSDKEVKGISFLATYLLTIVLYRGDNQQFLETLPFISDIIPRVRETINRKIASFKKRLEEVMHFFDDLYEVVLRTDEVLKDKGIQAWIVGHRTVMGDININFEKILSDWFDGLGYKNITSLSREYSFKRLPLSINSTILRYEEIQTMLQEYILIVQKNK
ncbi:DNA adenine methylase [Bacillus horti]|uniref:site-specific DNA-methyltransferase (cytosine-N(4)-specific) n=1 Tax=Caldalkalibacillus horti TaxID=77523 RepID=A0ABT9VYR4_9BACI|nr:DNA adenine methylase [Bacillus horti]MDQ0166135.1 site-specific DNA-adenine methylase [Bacillus horti]